MATVIEPLILDFLEWLAAKPRTHREVMETWRTSCPRLTVFEDAVDAGYVERVGDAGREPLIRVTPRGADFLKAGRRT